MLFGIILAAPRPWGMKTMTDLHSEWQDEGAALLARSAELFKDDAGERLL